MSVPSTLIVGIGSPHGDDQVGWRVADALADHNDADVCVRLARSPSKLLDWLDGVEHLVVCDACRGTERAGTVQRWAWPAPELEHVQWLGTHDLGLCAVLALSERLGGLPPQVTLWSVHAEGTEANEPMSAAVESAVNELVEKIRQEFCLRAQTRHEAHHA